MSGQYFRPGDTVVAAGAFGQRLRRRVVAVENGRVFLCTDEEFEAARRERREPIFVGFRIEAVGGDA